MEKQKFLDTLSDKKLLEKLYVLFNVAEKQARSFSLRFGNWVNIEKVCENTRGNCRWFSNGHITIDATRLNSDNDLGVIFHEVFHSAFHNSALHDGHQDESWGDAFCDAFRYFMEKQHLSGNPSGWFGNVGGLLGMGFNQAIVGKTNGEIGRIKKYLYPASLIIKKANRDYGEFCVFWFDLLRRKHSEAGSPILNQYFCYDMQAGQPM